MNWVALRRIKQALQPSKIIPHTSWTATGRWGISSKNFLPLVIGLSIFGVGDALLIQSNLGNAPWSVLAQGLALKSPLSIGQATAVISIGVLLLWIPLKERPGFGTLSNIALIALFIQIGIDHIPKLESYLALQLFYVFFGIFLVGIGSALYITCGLGPGPRDGLMTSLHNRTGVRVSRVRLSIEITVLIAGVLLGGVAGFGTAAFALLIGLSIATNLNIVARFANR